MNFMLIYAERDESDEGLVFVESPYRIGVHYLKGCVFPAGGPSALYRPPHLLLPDARCARRARAAGCARMPSSSRSRARRIATPLHLSWFPLDFISIAVSAVDIYALGLSDVSADALTVSSTVGGASVVGAAGEGAGGATGAGSAGGRLSSLRALRVLRALRLIKLVRLWRASRIFKQLGTRRGSNL